MMTRRTSRSSSWWRRLLLLAAIGLAPAGMLAAEYEEVGFERLAGFKFVPPPPAPAGQEPETGAEQIPAEIKALDGQPARVTGYMLPVRLVEGKVIEFLLVKDPSMCCFGVVPEMNEWVVVKMQNGGVPAVMDIPVSFDGRLKVGPQFENGYMTGIYELAGERMAEKS